MPISWIRRGTLFFIFILIGCKLPGTEEKNTSAVIAVQTYVQDAPDDQPRTEPGVAVTLTPAEETGFPLTLLTDSKGLAVFENVDEGVYLLSADYLDPVKNIYYSAEYEEPLQVKPGDSLAVELVLLPR
ncbi:MAG: carboxypeptidase regulatory-like domain-containing protein [Chlorobi bacterium]|nr:carboxypeptidase regulatory-like domain-containing protein [Chlorobiota bacterium]